MLRKSLSAISLPLSRALLNRRSAPDPWMRLRHPVPAALYGAGSHMEFEWYLEGDSNTNVSSVDDIIGWLSECRYASDQEQYQSEDLWQHPSAFEQVRIGDCEDFALWAWRKLIEIGEKTEFVAGRIRRSAADELWSVGHAWVHLELAGESYLLDTVCRERKVMLRKLDDVQEEYLPELSVDEMLSRFVYGGYYVLRRRPDQPMGSTNRMQQLIRKFRTR